MPKPLTEVSASREFMRYCDHDWPIYDKDPFSHRIVSINKRDGVFGGRRQESQLVAPGVYINENHVLTSYTPFRRLASDMNFRDLTGIYITHYKGYWLNADNVLDGYILESVDVTCGRQIYPNNATDYEQGEHFLHFPSFDLMVFKTEGKRTFVNENSPTLTTGSPMDFTLIGPQLTKLAKDNATLGDKLKFISLGMIDYDHIYNRNHLHSVTVDTDERLLEDCEEWFYEVNSFLCIRNLENDIAIGSGAFLFSDEAVIGVGSFTIMKGKESVHVFTDVRNVIELINVTCTVFDGYPDPPTTTTSPPMDTTT